MCFRMSVGQLIHPPEPGVQLVRTWDGLGGSNQVFHKLHFPKCFTPPLQ